MLNGVFWAYALTVLLLSGLGLGFQDIQKIQKKILTDHCQIKT
jgi:hypothetical protein